MTDQITASIKTRANVYFDGRCVSHSITLPPEVKHLILLCDADAEGRRARDNAYQAYKRPGLEIETDWPPGGLNDWAQLVQKPTNAQLG